MEKERKEKMKFVKETFIHLLNLPFTIYAAYIQYICIKPNY